MRNLDALLKAMVATLASADRPLADEIRAIRGSRWLTAGARSAAVKSRATGGSGAGLEPSVRNIVLRVGRPVLAIVSDTPQLEFKDSDSAVWRGRLEASGVHLQRAARAVGRIDVTGLPECPYVGTGWLVEKNTIVTNRHVAREFGRRMRGGFTFKQAGGARPMAASIDFLEEAGRGEQLEFPIVEILHIENEGGPDFALLRVEERSGGNALASPIPLATSPVRAEQQVAVIGYPARDSRVPDYALMQSIFGDVYDKKRLAPGQVTKAKADVVLHDCSTLGGNSGSVLLDLATGQAVGLHFAGRFLQANYAVPAAVVAARIEQVLRHRPGRPPAGPPPPVPLDSAVTPPTAVTGGGAPGASEAMVEGVAADYTSRTGYDPAFLGVKVPLPILRDRSDVLTFPWKGRRESVLK